MRYEDFEEVGFSPLEAAINMFIASVLDCAESEHLFAIDYGDFISKCAAIHDTLVILGDQLLGIDLGVEKTIKEAIVNWRLASNMVSLKRQIAGRNEPDDDPDWSPHGVIGYLYAQGTIEQGRAITKIIEKEELDPSLKKTLLVARDAIAKRHEKKIAEEK